jgi:hypothetical protein
MPIFSGDESRRLWYEINNAKTVEDLREALFTLVCKLQYLETRSLMGKEKKDE